MPTPPISLSGKRALVTGGASGIGLVAARTWQELGARVVVADIAAQALAEASAAGLHALAPADVRSERDADRVVCETVAALGGIDIVLTSAGLADAVTPAVEDDIDRWQRILDTNLRGTFLVSRAAARAMLPARSGAIVTVASVNGTSGFPRRSAYGASKAGVMAMTRALACEWAGSGVRINAVAPGYIRTPMVDRLIADGRIDVERIENRTPLGRLGTPEEIALATAFLVSDWASYITGTTLYVDGGWTAFGGAGDVATA